MSELPIDALHGRSIGGLAGIHLPFRPQLFWVEVLAEQAAPADLQFHCDISTGKNYARLPRDGPVPPSNGAYARSVAKAVDDATVEPHEARLVARALREAAAFAGDETPLRHLLSSCYCTRAALQPALLEASLRGHVEGVRLLLGAGADPSAQPEGKSALHVACEAADEVTATLLIEASPTDVNAPSAKLGGKTPLDVCRELDLGMMARRLAALAAERSGGVSAAPTPPPTPPPSPPAQDESNSVSELPPQPKDADEARDDATGSTYDGPRNARGERHGHGVWVHADGRRFDGEWRDGRRHGNGTMRYADGSAYAGGFMDGLRDGRGTLTDASAAVVFDGEWRQGKMQGAGRLHAAAPGWPWPQRGPVVYEGTFTDGRLHGAGRMAYVYDGEGTLSYEGEWREGRREGRGVWTDETSNVRYTGEWLSDARHGYGIFETGGGEIIYAGQWRSGRRVSWNYYRVRELLGWCIARLVYPSFAIAMLVALLAALFAAPGS